MTARATPWTPGPWSYVASTEHHGPYVTSEFGSDICDFYVMSKPSEFSTRNGGDSRPIHHMAGFADPNARLIAEAPAMASVIRNLEILARHTAQLIEAGTVPGPQCAVDLHAEADTARALLARIGSV